MSPLDLCNAGVTREFGYDFNAHLLEEGLHRPEVASDIVLSQQVMDGWLARNRGFRSVH